MFTNNKHNFRVVIIFRLFITKLPHPVTGGVSSLVLKQQTGKKKQRKLSRSCVRSPSRPFSSLRVSHSLLLDTSCSCSSNIFFSVLADCCSAHTHTHTRYVTIMTTSKHWLCNVWWIYVTIYISILYVKSYRCAVQLYGFRAVDKSSKVEPHMLMIKRAE